MYAFAGKVYGPKSPVPINWEVSKFATSARRLLNLRGKKLPPVSMCIDIDALKVKVAGIWPNFGPGSSGSVVFTRGVTRSMSIPGVRGMVNMRMMPTLAQIVSAGRNQRRVNIHEDENEETPNNRLSRSPGATYSSLISGPCFPFFSSGVGSVFVSTFLSHGPKLFSLPFCSQCRNGDEFDGSVWVRRHASH